MRVCPSVCLSFAHRWPGGYGCGWKLRPMPVISGACPLVRQRIGGHLQIAHHSVRTPNSELELDVSLRPLANNVVQVKYHGKAPWGRPGASAGWPLSVLRSVLPVAAFGFWLLLVLLGSEATMPTAPSPSTMSNNDIQFCGRKRIDISSCFICTYIYDNGF